MTTNDGTPAVAITGSSGLIGSKLVEDLARDHRVLGFDRKAPVQMPVGATFHVCDLTNDASVREAVRQMRTLSGGRIASLIHLAAYYDFSGEPSDLYERLTVQGTRRLLRECRLQGIALEQIVFSSTLLVMKPVEGDGEVIREDGPLQADWDYPRSKIEAERVLLEERQDSSCVILRIAGVYDEEGHSPPLTQQLWRIREKTLESRFFPGDSTRGQSFVHLEDLVRCFRAVVERRRQLDPVEIFLVGESEVVSYREIQQIAGQVLHGREWPTHRIPVPVAKAGAWVKERAAGDESFIKPWMIDLADAHYPISNERARVRLGWTPQHRLRDVLPSMAERMEQSPATFYEKNELPGSRQDKQHEERRER